MRTATSAILAVAAWVAAACASPAPPPTGGSLSWADCGGGVQCATLAVPVDHADPAGPALDLVLARRPAADRSDRDGVLLFNPGGPGASGVEALRSGIPLPAATLDRYDVVTWDPRGVGAGSPVHCGPELTDLLALDPAPDAADRADLDRLAPAVAAACADRTGELLDHLGTGDHVADMEAVRAAIGAPAISYLGLSYGTRIGLEYLARHGERVDTMILDSVVPPDLSVDELVRTQAAGLERGVEQLAEDGASTVAAVRRGAARGEVTGADGPLEPVRVDRAVVIAGYDPYLARLTRDGLREAAEGDGRTLDEQGLRYERSVDLPAYLATSCADGDGPRGEDGWDELERDVEAVAPTVGAVVVNELRACAFWPSGARGPELAVPAGAAVADATVLLLANRDDPATPVEWARSVAALLPTATLVEIDDEGHIALDDSACSRDLAGETLRTGALPADPSCP